MRRESPLRVDEALTVAEHVARLTDDEVTFPGGTYEYSNTGHVLLARALELVAGAPFDQLLQADV
ncbi:serine hydrolase, partial [Escherichia coli]|uniref:serine hydrolase n=1 Tax=Escherichia coli TaxID=562 RepID=UPI0034D4582B